MTCASCEEHVNHEVNKLMGIVSSNASYENENATIEFDRTKTNETEIEKAINSTGYNVKDKKRINADPIKLRNYVSKLRTSKSRRNGNK